MRIKGFLKCFINVIKNFINSFFVNKYVKRLVSVLITFPTKLLGFVDYYNNYITTLLIFLLTIFYFNGVLLNISCTRAVVLIEEFFLVDGSVNQSLMCLADSIFSLNYVYVLCACYSFVSNFLVLFILSLKSFIQGDSINFMKIVADFELFNLDLEVFGGFFNVSLITLFFYKLEIFCNYIYFFNPQRFNFGELLNYNLFQEYPLFFFCGFSFLFSTVISLLCMSYLSIYGVFIVNLITLFFFWLSVLFYLDFFLVSNNFIKIITGKWFTLYGFLNVNFEFYIDSISYSFMLLTITIAMFVYIYVYSYFRYDANVERLILFINCFVISMVVLVTSGNLFVFFLGWELIGLTSFFLINFWSSRISTLKSAFKAYVFNKFSDVSILISIIIVISTTNDTSILILNNQISHYINFYVVIMGLDFSIIELISFFFIFAAFVKSAQFGTHTWLPDSMEAPVPASALIHSATLVSAGVFLLLRFSPLFEVSIYAQCIIPLVGSFTAFFGGICAAYQSDIKRILAYSTISHCGFLMLSYSLLVPEYTILYLYVHGFFKAAVFLCAGNVIRFSRNYQDFRKMGFFAKYLPFEFFASFICLINLCGLPFTLGFYIKHLLIVGTSTNSIIQYFILINVIGGAVSGLFYSYKFFFYSFLDVKKSNKIIYDDSASIKLKSHFYSNTSLASNVAIICLIITSYCISLCLFNVFINKNSFGSALDIYSVYSSLNIELFFKNTAFLENISYFNWLILLLILSLIFISWRRLNKSHITIKFFTFIVVVLLIIFIFMFIKIN